MNIFAYLKELKDQFFDCSPFFDFVRDILDPAARNLQQISNRRKRNETRILDIGVVRVVLSIFPVVIPTSA